ncbi:gastrula zinc finger protein XlCGF67.1-like [Phlebotomus argentipes]|uniref:gastrula zinc finger protein XlCGF67.1-like n=1 Tax=Phlebotomus argentipes TaxID=94469 RepID=UPI002892C1EE|nr:gastrula zinc finger protein XlCGF67.1-like [Phlebotomus argentipes]
MVSRKKKSQNNLNQRYSSVKFATIADHPCRVCCLSFATEFGLRQHSREHTADECAAAEETQPKVTCGSCDDVFSSKYLLYRHERNVHDSGEKFSCSKCSEILPSMPLLFAHERRHREFRCKICGKTLKSQVALNEHQNSHSGEKPFKCECGKAFAYNSNLVEHRKMHTMVKEHKCSHCDKAFRRSNMLKEHERVHTRDRPFKCSFCGADFTQSNSLKKHIRKFHRMCQQCGEYVGDDIDEMIHKCSDSK